MGRGETFRNGKFRPVHEQPSSPDHGSEILSSFMHEIYTSKIIHLQTMLIISTHACVPSPRFGLIGIAYIMTKKCDFIKSEMIAMINQQDALLFILCDVTDVFLTNLQKGYYSKKNAQNGGNFSYV